jgi:hypothetical protein
MSQCTAEVLYKREWNDKIERCSFRAVKDGLCGTHLRSRDIRAVRAIKEHDTISREAVIEMLEGKRRHYWQRNVHSKVVALQDAIDAIKAL